LSAAKEGWVAVKATAMADDAIIKVRLLKMFIGFLAATPEYIHFRTRPDHRFCAPSGATSFLSAAGMYWI
jgi:hypothetical protein